MAYKVSWPADTGVVAGAGPDAPLSDKADSPFQTVGHPVGFAGQLVARRMGALLIADVQGSPLRLTDRATPATDPVVIVQALVSGQATYHAPSGATEPLEPGDLVIRRAHADALVSSTAPCHIVSIALSERLLSPRLLPRKVVENTVLRSDGVKRLSHSLLQTFMIGLCERDAQEAEPSGVVVDALGALVAMAVYDGRPQAAVEVDLPTRRLAQLLDYLKENAANPSLTPRLAASDLKMSLRYLHKLMTLTGRSFGAEVTSLRLEFCRTSLARGGYRTIAEVAITAGFNDLSQFNRQFRAAFDMTPSEARRRAAQPSHPAGEEIGAQRRTKQGLATQTDLRGA